MPNVFTPKKGESVRHIQLDKEERKQHMKEFRDQKEMEQKLKEERFAAIQERRKKNNPGGSGGGINITVDSDK